MAKNWRSEDDGESTYHEQVMPDGERPDLPVFKLECPDLVLVEHEKHCAKCDTDKDVYEIDIVLQWEANERSMSKANGSVWLCRKCAAPWLPDVVYRIK